MLPTFALLAATLIPAAEPIPLASRINGLIAEHKGNVTVACVHLGTGERLIIRGDEVMPTASLIKLPVMVEVYAQAKDGKVKLDDMLTLAKDDMVQGSGILTEHFSPGAKFSLRDAVRLMIVYSDNTATNMVLDKVGIKAVNERMESLGLKETQINAKVFKGSTTSIAPERTKKYGLGSTTAKEMLTLLELLHKKELVSKDASKAMLEHLKKCDDKDKFSRFLPKSVTLAHKTGTVSNARTDAGILYFKEGPVALVVLSNDNEDKRFVPDNAGNKLCAEIAKCVVEYFVEKSKMQKK
jgi:D-alanyl-D-alanine carboxypeptidase (penicillin-binding protein 5/6)/beta-lactamase class A